MTEFIMDFETALNKIISRNPRNAALTKRLLLLILAPILRLPVIHGISQVLNVDRDSLYRALGTLEKAQWLNLLRLFGFARVATVLRHNQTRHESNQSRNRITIAVDDTGFSKSGHRMPLIGYIWNAVLKRATLGTQALYFYAIVGAEKRRIPLDLRLCRGKGRVGRPTKSRHDLVVEMMTDFAHALRRAGCPTRHIVFVADAWFGSGKIFQAAQACGFSLVCKGKSNYRFQIDGDSLTAAELLAQPHAWRTSAVAPGYRYARYSAQHSEFGSVIVTIFDDDGALSYLIANNPDHASPKMIADYHLRWPVEVFFKDSKQVLALNKFAVRSQAKIYGHFVLRVLTYILLDSIRTQLFHRKRTIGECATWLYYHVFLNPNPKRDNLGLHSLKSYLPDFRGVS